MDRSTKESWLQGPGDLREAEVEDVPVKGQTVRVRGLPAAYSNEAQSEATELKQLERRGHQETIATINTAKLECLQFAHGVIEPTFTLKEAEIIATKYGPAFRKVIEKIDELSGVDKDAIEQANATFPAGAGSSNGSDVADAAGPGDGGPAVPARAGAGTEDVDS